MSASPSTPVTPDPPQPESVRETIESIIVALILAFVFRAFIVEAFVIPTGSMASTLYGLHGTMICPNCGWQYAYGLNQPGEVASSNQLRANPRAITDKATAPCRNCRWPNRPVEINDALGNAESGDRILVLKWPYDLGIVALGPQRWNVVVFKDPSDIDGRDGVTNYIKRLAGMPGEVLEIIDGDVYAAPIDELSEEARQVLDELRHCKYLHRVANDVHGQNVPRPLGEQRTRLVTHALTDAVRDEIEAGPKSVLERERAAEARLPAVLDELNRKLRIQRKSDHAQNDLWRVAYDHDYPPLEIAESQPQWLPTVSDTRWTVEPRRLSYDDLESDSRDEIRLSALFDAYSAYNAVSAHRSFRGEQYQPVSDMRIRFVLDYAGGDGYTEAVLARRGARFAGRVTANGSVQLFRLPDAPATEPKLLAETQIRALQPGDKLRIAFENCDYRVRLFVNDEMVAKTTDELFYPDVARLRGSRPPAATAPVLAASQIQVTLRHMVVDTDVYYLSRLDTAAAPFGGHAWGVEGFPILIRDGEYFMLGDNSAQSKDSRLWDTVGPHLLARGEDHQLGTVPRDQLIGRAFFVYWPAGLRSSLVPMLRNIGWIPNFGQMRWIR